MYDIAIIGGGVIGLAIAWELAEAGVSVVLFERGVLGHEASWAAAGMLAPCAEAQFGEESLVRMGLASVAAYPAFVERLERETGVDVDFKPIPAIVTGVDRDEAAAVRHMFKFQQSLDLDVRWLRRDEVLEREPTLSPRVIGGVLCGSDHRVDNRRLVEALILAASHAGVMIHEYTEAAPWLEQGVCRGVKHGDETTPARHSVIAAGAWSSAFEEIPADLRPAVRPVKGQMLSVQCTEDVQLTHTIRTPRVYLVPRQDGRLIVGATSEERGFDKQLTAGGVLYLLEHAYEAWPAIYELPLLETWTGLRPGTPDNLPIMGASGIEGLAYATGHYRNGILLTPYSASTMREFLIRALS